MSTLQFEAAAATKMIAVRKEREARPYHFEQIEGEGSPKLIPLAGTDLVAGRAEDADIRLSSRLASRQHALLTRRGTDYVIRDNDSHNGIYLNGVRVHSAVLRDGDIIQIADFAFVYRES